MRHYKIDLKTIIIFSALFTGLFFSSSQVYARNSEAEALNRKGVNAMNSGNYQEAVQLLKQAMTADPAWGEPCYNAARLLRLLGKREDMIKLLRKANAIEPDNKLYADSYLEVLNEELAKAENEANTEKVEELENEIVKVDPGNLKLGLKNIQRLVNDGEKSDALDLAKDIIDKNSKYRSKYEVKEMGELYYSAACLALDEGDYDSAKGFAESARKYEFDKKKEADELANRIKKTINEKIAEYVNSSKSAQNSGDYTKAKSLLKEAKKYDADSEILKNALTSLSENEDTSKVIAQAKSLNSSGRWFEARELLLKTLEKYPDCEEASKMLASYGEKETALKNAVGIPDVPTTLKERQRVIENIIKAGSDYFEKKNYKMAMSQFNKAFFLIEEDKNLSKYKEEINKYVNIINSIEDDKKNWTKALDARNAGDYEDVLKYLKKLPEDYDIQYFSYLAEAYYKTGDLEKARMYGLEQLSKQPENNRARFVLGCVNLDSGNLDSAYKYFSDVRASDPEYPEIGDKLALASKKFLPVVISIVILALLAWIAWAIKKNLPIYNKNSMIRRAKQYFKRQDWDECIETLHIVKRSEHLNVADHFEIAKLFAQSYLKKGKYDLAIGECKHLISLSPKSEEPHLWLGYAYLGRRMMSPESLPELLNLYKKESRNIALVSLLGSYYAQQKKLTEEGVTILEQWLNLDYDNVEVLKPLGKYYLNRNRSDEKAMKVFNKMMELGSADSDFMLGVANVHLKSRQFQECLDLCQRVIEQDPNNVYVHSILLDAYKLMNRLPELIEIYSNALKECPYNVAFQNGLKEAQIAYSKLQERNAKQAAAEAAAVMQRMAMDADNPQYEEQTESQSGYYPEENNEEGNALEPGQIACPSCGQANAEGTYCCQHCGANMF